MSSVLENAPYVERPTRRDPWPRSLPEIVAWVRREYDWEAVLPPRAVGRLWRIERRVKRVLDIVLSLAGLIILAPVFLLLALMVRLTSPGPVFYRWMALGYRARPFVGYKFRTMIQGAEAMKPDLLSQNEMQGPVFKMRKDPRVTRIGQFLRKYSLDELPQLWCVLKGEMSLVGPRPPTAEEYANFEPWQWGKLAVTPGLTCFWQILGRSEIRDFSVWARLDLEYIRTWDLWLDFKILLRTIPVVVRGDGAY